MTRKLLALASTLTLSSGLALGCGGGGLEVTGHATIDATRTTTGFTFGTPVRLDGGAGLVTGNCVMTRQDAGGYSVIVDLMSGDQNPEGRAVRSMTIMARTDAESGSVEAQLGLDDFANAACAIEVTTADGSNGQVAFRTTRPCVLAGPGTEEATVDIDLSLSRCGVQ